MLFDYISALLQSNEELVFKTWEMTVDIFRNPTGGVLRPKKPSFLFKLQEADAQGRVIDMSDDSEPDSEGDLSEFVVSDGYLSSDEQDIHCPPRLVDMIDKDTV